MCNLITNNFGSINHIPYVQLYVCVCVFVCGIDTNMSAHVCACLCLATNYKFQLCTDCALLRSSSPKNTQGECARRGGCVALMEPIKRAKAAQTIKA